MKNLSEFSSWEGMVNQVIMGDCFEGMKLIPDESIDLIVTDPPYGMNYQSSRRTDKFLKIAQDTSLDWVHDCFKNIFRILKPNTHAYLFCNEYSMDTFRSSLKQCGFDLKRMLIWIKNNHTSGDLDGDYGNQTEYILFVHKGRKPLNGKRDTNIIKLPRVANLNHPTEKPVSLFQYLIEKSSNKGQVVCDPFMGSWTTARACKDLGRNFIGFELEEAYCKVGEQRLAQENLF